MLETNSMELHISVPHVKTSVMRTFIRWTERGQVTVNNEMLTQLEEIVDTLVGTHGFTVWNGGLPWVGIDEDPIEVEELNTTGYHDNAAELDMAAKGSREAECSEDRSSRLINSGGEKRKRKSATDGEQNTDSLKPSKRGKLLLTSAQAIAAMRALRRKFSIETHHVVRVLRDPNFLPPDVRAAKAQIIKVDQKEHINCSHVNTVLNSKGGILIKDVDYTVDEKGTRFLQDIFGGWNCVKIYVSNDGKRSNPKHVDAQFARPRGSTFAIKVKDAFGTPVSDNKKMCKGIKPRTDAVPGLYKIPGTNEWLDESKDFTNVEYIYVNQYGWKDQPYAKVEAMIHHLKKSNVSVQPVFIQLRCLEEGNPIATKLHVVGCNCATKLRL